MIQTVYFLQPGDTPWSYSHNPGELPGPWADTAAETIALIREQAGPAGWDVDPDQLGEHWLRENGTELWIVHGPEEGDE